MSHDHTPQPLSQKSRERPNVTQKLRDKRRTANTTTQDSIHVQPCDLLKAVINGVKSMAIDLWLEAIIRTKLSVRLVRGSVHLT